MDKIEVFLQGEGMKDIVIVRVPKDGFVHELIAAAGEQGLPTDDEGAQAVAFIENSETALDPDLSLEEAGISHRQHVHVHRGRKIEVTVSFNGIQKAREFPPSFTVGKVKKWTVKEFGMAEVDATEHVLQISGSTIRPDEHTHIGNLVMCPQHQLYFDLVPKIRVEG